jgi:hypothetical protein
MIIMELPVARMALGFISSSDLAYRALQAALAASYSWLSFLGPKKQWPKILRFGCKCSHGSTILPSLSLFTLGEFSSSLPPSPEDPEHLICRHRPLICIPRFV